jgi:disulfide bond formation protein DsbB
MRKLFLLLVTVLALSLVLSGCGGDDGGEPGPGPGENTGSDAGPTESSVEEDPAALTGDPAAGKAEYDMVCFACHGADATGVSGLGKDLTISEFTQGLTDAELVAFIKVGRSVSDPANTTGIDMPPKGGNPALSDQDIYDIVAYLRTLEK